MIVDPATSDKTESYIAKLVELRQKKGMTEEQAREIPSDKLSVLRCYDGEDGDADGMVSGACHSTADTLRPCLQILKTKPGTKLVSAFFVMVVPDCDMGADGTFIFGDSGLEQNPDPEKLANIALSSAESFRTLTGKEPVVAMLSHSTKGSAKHADVDKVVEATRLAKEMAPELKLDGELQLDAAIVPAVGESESTWKPGCRTCKCSDLPRSGCRKYRIQACTEACKSRSIWSSDTGNCSTSQRSVPRMQRRGYRGCSSDYGGAGTGTVRSST